ncbi:beta-hexosaminidase [Paraburkholderia saeva]|uniref:Beta-hexosaminidase n=1 Tax=Paraburkholderia saeva TaxID=2777537 RepID=A0A9N8RYA4_9BURK|nr:beta-hexosaminidase [Paraburkholderia saeva]CAG4906300.1 hypothetical protein LMG31841_03544 [Paraburkholderia saeva]
MQRPKFKAPPEPTRRDTIGLRSIVTYDPMAPRPTTPIMVGQYVVARRPLHGSVHTLYMILDGTQIVGTSISYPSEADCASAVNKHRRRLAASMAVDTIEKAKKRTPCPARAKEAV